MIYRTVGVKSFQRNHGYLLSCHLQALSITSSEQLVVRNAGTVHPALFSLVPNLMAYGSSSSRGCKFFLLGVMNELLYIIIGLYLYSILTTASGGIFITTLNYVTYLNWNQN